MTNRAKKITVLSLLLIVLMATTIGCTQSTPPEKGESTQSNKLEWTDKPVSVYIPGKPGGGSDLTTRYLIQTWGEEVNIDFKPVNYDTTVASFQALVGTKPDGLTLEVAHSALITQYLTGATGIHPLDDVTLIAHIGNNGLRALAVPVDAPYDTLEDFVAYMKENPGKVKAGISPNGTTQFSVGVIEKELGVKFNYVEASAETDRLTNLAGGFIDFGTVSLANAIEYEKAGKLKVLATIGADGAKIKDFEPEASENYKTLQEMGYDNAYAVTNYYVIGPAGMDEEQVKLINESLKGITEEDSAYVKGMLELGQVPAWNDLESSRTILEDELNTMTDVAKLLDIYGLED